MASFKLELPKDIMRDIQRIDKDYEKIFGGMTKAGAEVVRSAVMTNAPPAVKSSDLMNCLKLTVTYKTPSDDGINTKVGFYGYFTNHNGQRSPAPLVCNLFEYGCHKHRYPKYPFLRKSFNKGAITKAMLQAQRELSRGLLDE